MIPLTTSTHILLATQPADFRKGIDGFVALCKQSLEQEPRTGVVFVFINRSKTMIRALHYDGTGFWLMTKRLSQGRFQGWPTNGVLTQAIAAKQLIVLLRGQSFSHTKQTV
ncbi:IS66 family insertion sequence element accessory protein TnpB [Endozoicomonas sp. SM1973]|uniref:IS66 family insertion sequence element accessory protein TnpB n=1 Tax=Spartinivicinus marinus TaxID=2994442 RepID=A0A853IPP9_9GAMM|nr:IS66 family insertion sequence element accessory protein TnpB [Spartinivicinus marinus]MCX4030124.1 IS66 family insertion sequence element accessory protein TnpB [Spartinivicinus marinus]MCX4030137.1 IS66 family insertion sequence element accessory protein TnpB [Spartinivicinus marinus]NYZ69876.1 IS66 family insertion sequence element accessory protein TnpB [Spartinivicinus marinus]